MIKTAGLIAILVLQCSAAFAQGAAANKEPGSTLCLPNAACNFPTGITVTTTGRFGRQNGASVSRLGDRILVGGGTESNAAYPASGDWLTNYRNASPPVYSNGNTSMERFAKVGLP